MRHPRIAFAALALAITSTAFLPSAHAKDGEPKEARDKVREERKELRDAMRSGDAGAAKEAREDLRKARKAARFAEMQKKYGSALGTPAVKDEMKTHAKRMARLHRIETLAKNEKKDAIVKRTDAAIEKEKARHDKRMDQLKSGGDAGTPAVKPAMDGGSK